PSFAVVPLPARADDKAVGRAVASLLRVEGFERHGQVLVVGRADAPQSLSQLKAVPRPELTPAFTAAGDGAVQAVLLPSDDLRRAVEELLPTLPAEAGGGPVTALTRGLRWVALSADAPPKMALRVLVQARDAPSAVALQGLGGKVLQALGEGRDV